MAALTFEQARSEVLKRVASQAEAPAVERVPLHEAAGRVLAETIRADRDYPGRLKRRLKESAPAVLFGAGDRELIGQPGLAVVGSRHTDPRRQELAEQVGNACGRCGLVLYSGGARGVDRLATRGAIAARGHAVSVLADSLQKA
ncbi:MAG: DNA-processing protein DprA, partial [Dehalococcoidia bacterium]|nr:DNA-processing protein DprA [Dehalococcoidia bacterium]